MTQPVATVSLPTELAYAGLGAFVAGVGSFTGALTVTTASDTKALASAGIAAGITALTFFGNSLRNWLASKPGQVVANPNSTQSLP